MRRILPFFAALFALTFAAVPAAVAEHEIAYEFGTLSGGSGTHQALSATTRAFAVGVTSDEAFVSLRDAESGAEIAHLVVDPLADRFGYAVALSARGLALGGPHSIADQGAVFLLGPRDTAPSKTVVSPATGGRYFGSATAWTGDDVLVGDQERIVSGDPGTGPGRAYLVHARTGAVRRTLQAPVPHDGAGFGATVATFRGGFAVAEVGTAALPGAVHLYDRRGRYRETLTAPLPIAGDAFGAALAGDGARLLIGAPSNVRAPEARAAYLARRDHGHWRLVRTFVGEPYAAVFGPSVALAGHRIALGSPANYAGVFLFDTRTEGLTEQIPFPPFDGFSGDGYHAGLGSAVAFAGRIVLTASTVDDEDYIGWVVGYRPRRASR